MLKFEKVKRVEMPDNEIGPPTNEAARQMEIWLMLQRLLLCNELEIEEKE